MSLVTSFAIRIYVAAAAQLIGIPFDNAGMLSRERNRMGHLDTVTPVAELLQVTALAGLQRIHGLLGVNGQEVVVVRQANAVALYAILIIMACTTGIEVSHTVHGLPVRTMSDSPWTYAKTLMTSSRQVARVTGVAHLVRLMACEAILHKRRARP